MSRMTKAMAREILNINKHRSHIAFCSSFGQIEALLAAGRSCPIKELCLNQSDISVIEAALVLAGFKLE